MKTILILLTSSLKRYPPILSLLDSIRGKYKITIIAGEKSSETDAKYLSDEHIQFIYLHSTVSQNNVFTKAYNHIKQIILFRHAVKKYLRKNNPDLIWVSTAETALCLGKIIRGRPFILNMFELYDRFPKRLSRLKNTAHEAIKIVTPEINRAKILRVWWKLEHTPVVIPNKPCNHPQKKNLSLEGIPGEVISSIKKKIILYQGHITPDRKLDALCKAVASMRDYCLVLMGGETSYLKQLKTKYPFIIHQGFVPPPYHLNITSHAFIGIVTYTYYSLNTIFCAPNKIWEYSGFGIPMLGNDIPGLSDTIGKFEAGICTDTDDVEKIKSAIFDIEKAYPYYSQQAQKMYNSVDIKQMFLNLMP